MALTWLSVGPEAGIAEAPGVGRVLRRGAWARVTVDQFRPSALQTFQKRRAPSNTPSNKMCKGGTCLNDHFCWSAIASAASLAVGESVIKYRYSSECAQ